jgi:hypothetical protein
MAAKEPTHYVYVLKRSGRRLEFGEWHRAGVGRGPDGDIDLAIDYVPINGFSGYLKLCPMASPPPPLPKGLTKAPPSLPFEEAEAPAIEQEPSDED